MRRRDFTAGAVATALAWPAGAGAQSSPGLTVGILFLVGPEPANRLLREALGRIGYREGENVQFEMRNAEGSEKRLAEMAAELVARKVDVIFASTTPAVIAARAATGTIPIIMASAADPVGSGLVASLSRPGGNVTGVDAAIAETAGVLLGLLREAVPAASTVGLLLNVSDPFHRRLVETVEKANAGSRVDLRIIGMSTPGEIDQAFEQLARQDIRAAFVQPTLPRQRAIELALRHRIATCSPVFGYAQLGGFMSYSGSARSIYTVAAEQFEQIRKGARPADLPVRQPSQFDLVLNLRTAQAIGVAIPPLLLAKASDLVE